MQLSTAVRDARNNAIETTIGASPILRLRTGNLPANCAAADVGTVISEMTLPADYLSASAAGVKSLQGTWEDLLANAAGYVQHYRIYDSGGATCHIQGLVSQAWSATTAVVLNQQMHNGGNVYRCTTAGTTAGAGGPTGTGAGIADGTAVWTYIGLVEMTITNTNIAVNQPVSVLTFTITDPNG